MTIRFLDEPKSRIRFLDEPASADKSSPSPKPGERDRSGGSDKLKPWEKYRRAQTANPKPWEKYATGAILGGKDIPRAPAKSSGSRTLRKGMKGDDVAKMQKALGISADGDFGFGTQTSVKKWQKRNGLVADGIVGSATQAKMYG